MIEEIQIGTQIWMSKNLDVNHFRNGDSIPYVAEDEKWNKLKNGAYCHYNNDSSNSLKFGKLYNANAVLDDRGLAPQGWHIPTLEEWDILENHIGKMQAGLNLKALTGWNENSNGIDLFGFNAYPAGARDSWGDFYNLGFDTYWWSSTTSLTGIFYRYLSHDLNFLQQWNDDGSSGFSVRCIKD
jgi:uncharacterized protein (TIGR02145 family)